MAFAAAEIIKPRPNLKESCYWGKYNDWICACLLNALVELNYTAWFNSSRPFWASLRLARGIITYPGTQRSAETHPAGVVLIMSTDPQNPIAPSKKWFRFTCFGRSRARQPRGQHPAVATSSTGRHSSQATADSEAQPGAKRIDLGSQPNSSPPADKETILQWTKITLKMSEKVLGMVPIAKLDKIPSLLLEFVAIYEVC